MQTTFKGAEGIYKAPREIKGAEGNLKALRDQLDLHEYIGKKQTLVFLIHAHFAVTSRTTVPIG